MRLLGSVALVLAGALLYWRGDGSWAGVGAGTFGVILIGIGTVGVLLSLLFGSSWGVIAERAVDDVRRTPRR